jgi:multiple sugar transport system substrate-binding protein
MRVRNLGLAAALAMAPLGATAADLVVWWDEGYYPKEQEAIRETIAAFEQETGKQVELVLHSESEHPKELAAALEAGQPPDFAFGLFFSGYIGQWAFDGRLVDLSDAVGHFVDLFDPDVLSWAVLLNASTGQTALYGLPMGRTSYHVHVWKSVLERAGFTLEDIPREWEAFWSFWCDEVQPAARKALGSEDIWVSACPWRPGQMRRTGFSSFRPQTGRST